MSLSKNFSLWSKTERIEVTNYTLFRHGDYRIDADLAHPLSLTELMDSGSQHGPTQKQADG